LAQRCRDVARHEHVGEALDRGDLVRTHALRPTWHFVAPEDLSWVLTATSPRVHRASAFQYRQLGVDEVVMSKARRVLEHRLTGQHATRAELGEALAAAGLPAEGVALAHVLMYAELEGWICSGTRRGNQQTYALVAERVPDTDVISRDEAVSRLASRYFATRGPATTKDLAVWASLTVTEARRATESVAPELERLDLDGRTYWVATSSAGSRPSGSTAERGSTGADVSPTAETGGARVDLVQVYDEVVMSYSESRDVMTGGHRFPHQLRTTFFHALLVDGQLAGTWRYVRDPRGSPSVIETQPLRPLTGDEEMATEAEVARFATFVGQEVTWRKPG